MSDMINIPQPEPEGTSIFVPRIDVLEERERFVVRADMPGCDPKGIDVQYEAGALTIRGPVPGRGAEGALRRREYGVGDFLRRFNVTEAIDVERIRAEYADGVLTLVLPKVEAARPRSIPVKAF